MSKHFFTIITLVFALTIYGQESKIYDSLIMKSSLLKKDKKFAIYLPEGYESSLRKYPVLYLLHGGQGNQTDWIQKGELRRIADREIGEGNAAQMIIVMPDAEMTYYMNSANGKYQFEDFFLKELIPYIERNYRCRTEKTYRAVAGLSMGGFGSLLYAIHQPGLFGACAAMSAAVRTDEEINEMPLDEYLRRYKTAMGELKQGDTRITDFWNHNSILYLVKNMPEEQKKAVRFYLDIGDDDFLYRGNALLHITMRDLNIPHEFRIRNGEHNWNYWRSGLPGVLAFISESFR